MSICWALLFGTQPRPSLATELQAKGQPVPENHKMVGLQGPGTEKNGTSILLPL